MNVRIVKGGRCIAVKDVDDVDRALRNALQLPKQVLGKAVPRGKSFRELRAERGIR